MNPRFDVRTSRSLLEKLRVFENRTAWSRFLELYLPMIETWGNRFGLSPADGEELCSRLMTRLVESLPRFHYDPDRGSFRGWLKTVTQNELANFARERRRQTGGMGQSAVYDLLLAHADDVDDLVAGVHDRSEGMLQCVQDALQEVQRSCDGDERKSWDLFARILLSGEKIDRVAAESGLSYHATAMRVQRIKKKVRARATQLLAQRV